MVASRRRKKRYDHERLSQNALHWKSHHLTYDSPLQVGHALRDASSCKCQAIMDIHLEHARFKDAAIQDVSPSECESEAEQVSSSHDLKRAAPTADVSRGLVHYRDSFDDDDVSSLCLSGIESTDEVMNERYPSKGKSLDEEASNFAPSHICLTWAGESSDPVPIRPHFLERSHSMDDEAVGSFLMHAFDMSQL